VESIAVGGKGREAGHVQSVLVKRFQGGKAIVGAHEG